MDCCHLFHSQCNLNNDDDGGDDDDIMTIQRTL